MKINSYQFTYEHYFIFFENFKVKKIRERSCINIPTQIILVNKEFSGQNVKQCVNLSVDIKDHALDELGDNHMEFFDLWAVLSIGGIKCIIMP